MGNGESVRETHFQRPNPADVADVETDEHHISISNKMVERLVEDATLAGGAAAVNTQPTPKGDYRDKIYIDKLKSLDENHSDRLGITVEDLNAIATRIDMRTANMVGVDPVCAEFSEQVIKCYNTTDVVEDTIKCWETVGKFTECVQEAGASRLRTRTQKEARELARRSRHVAHAREHALRDLGPPSA